MGLTGVLRLLFANSAADFTQSVIGATCSTRLLANGEARSMKLFDEFPTSGRFLADLVGADECAEGMRFVGNQFMFIGVDAIAPFLFIGVDVDTCGEEIPAGICTKPLISD